MCKGIQFCLTPKEHGYNFHALFAYADNANAYAQLAVFYAHLCGKWGFNPYMRHFKILHIRRNSKHANMMTQTGRIR